jgi:hypothetical protein
LLLLLYVRLVICRRILVLTGPSSERLICGQKRGRPERDSSSKLVRRGGLNFAGTHVVSEGAGECVNAIPIVSFLNIQAAGHVEGLETI